MVESPLRICTWNCQGIRNKYHELDLFLRTYDIDILLATETKLHSRLNFFIPGYKIYRADHPDDRAKGGSAIFIKQQLEHCEGVATQVAEAQVARIEIKLGGRDLLLSTIQQSTATTIGRHNSGNEIQIYSWR
jgi:exonuclease III